MSRLRIAGGRVIDPANGIDDEVRDLWVEDVRVIAPPNDSRADRTIDARGLVVMPGGVDVHCHIVGPKVNAGRALGPEQRREHEGGVPSTFVTGARYAGLGYTTAVDAAVAPLAARQAHHELRDTPILDAAVLALVGDHHYVLELVRDDAHDRLRSFLAWLLKATRAYGLKVVNPGGVERWKQGHGNVAGLDDEVEHFGVTPRRILLALARAADALALPHPIHLHGLNLGLPGNAATTLETMRALDGHRVHMAHIQFHSYGGSADDLTRFDSQVPMLADYVNAQANITLDVGQVMFGPTTSMTADGAVGQYLHQVTGRKWFSHDIELETGCGVVPITYEDTNAVHALQWAIGLEWFLRVDDPWKVALSTDHPNGGSFLAYPEIIALLMDEGHRRETLGRLPARVRTRSGLGELSRQYSLAEIAVITRAAPARILGLVNKGHLGIGADADVTIYSPDDDKRRMFALPRYVLKEGEVVVDDGELRASPSGRTHHVEREHDEAVIADFKQWFSRYSSIQFSNFEVDAKDG